MWDFEGLEIRNRPTIASLKGIVVSVTYLSPAFRGKSTFLGACSEVTTPAMFSIWLGKL